MSDRPAIEPLESVNADTADESKPNFSLADANLSDIRTNSVSEVGAAATNHLDMSADESVYPNTRQEQLQEFVDGFGKIGKLYGDAKPDGNFGRFQDRMANVYATDRQAFMDLARVGESMTDSPAAPADKIGEGLADAMTNALTRKARSGDVDLTSPEMENLQGAVASMMIAAIATFDQGKIPEQTLQMVDSFDTNIQKTAPLVRGIIWGDNGEPGLAIVPPGETIDRHKYLP